MRRHVAILYLIGLALLLFPAAQARQASAVAEFKRQQPCPATGKTRGTCPGYIVDHIEPLCAGGADAPANMQWQTVEDAKAKDKHEHRQCAAIRRKTREESATR